MALDIDRVRGETPGCLHRLHFNNAGASLMPRPVIDTVVEHLQLESRIGGYEAADAVRDRIEAVYAAAARLVGCQAPEIALFENATRAWDAVFYAIPFASGDRIVTGRAEYCSNYMAYLQVTHATGAEIVVIGDDEHGQINVDELRAVLDERVKLIALSHVPTSGGLVNPAAQVGAAAREARVPFLLDACQSVGQMPVDVYAIGCDFLATTGRKFLRAPRGTGFLYANRERIGGLHPAVVEVGSAAWTATDRYTLKDDARRFETWEASTALRLGLGRAIEYALDLGLQAIWDRVAALAGELRSGLGAVDGVSVHDLGVTKCGIVTFTVHGVKSENLVSELRKRSVNVDVSTPADTRLDFEARRLSSLVRASVHYFNTDDEITRFCDLVAMLSRAGSCAFPTTGAGTEDGLMTADSPLADRTRLAELLELERRTFSERNPRSRAMFDQSKKTLLNGVPMSWMSCWPGGYPVFVASAKDASITDVDGHTYVDFCLGDTGAFAGHSPGPTARAVQAQYTRGATTMLPTEDAAWVSTELARRFGLPVWQFSLTATDANRWALRLARWLTGRAKVLVFNGCYHGTVDEAVIRLDEDGRPMPGPGNVGSAIDPTKTTEVIEFNDIQALERALRPRTIACVLTEPVLTNAAGIILPQTGYHDALRELTAGTGTYLIVDETQTFPAGPGGYTGSHGLRPDFLTIGKAIAGGVPLGALGMRHEVADAIIGAKLDMGDTGAFGGTLAGNALSLAAARATLGEVFTDDAHRRMNALASRLADGVQDIIAARGLPWHVVQIGARLEYRYSPQPPRNATESARSEDPQLDAFLHLYLLNRGILITPFHNMALMSPATTEADIDYHTQVFAAATEQLLSSS